MLVGGKDTCPLGIRLQAVVEMGGRVHSFSCYAVGGSIREVLCMDRNLTKTGNRERKAVPLSLGDFHTDTRVAL